jgi:transposase-like protein
LLITSARGELNPVFDRTPAIAGRPRHRPGVMPMSDTFSRMEFITGAARRRRFTTDQKLAVVAETMQPGLSISYVARRHGLSSSLAFRRRRLITAGGQEALRADDDVVPAATRGGSRNAFTNCRAQDARSRAPQGGPRPRAHKKAISPSSLPRRDASR